MKIIAALIISLTLLASPVAAQPDLSDYELVLLPTYNAVRAGAYGSQWGTELTAHNASESSVRYYPHFPLPATPGSPSVPTGPFVGSIPRGTSVLVPLHMQSRFTGFRTPTPVSARLLFLHKAGADSVTLYLRARDLTRFYDNFGSQIPVVRERDFRSGTVHLVDIPQSPPFRRMVRIYDPYRTGTAVVVRLFATDNGFERPLGERLMTPTVATIEPGSIYEVYKDAPTFPGLIEFDLDSTFASELTAERDLFNWKFRVDVIATSPELRFWAMATITNNETQHVTVVSPN